MGHHKVNRTHIVGILGGEKAEEIFEEIMADNIPNLLPKDNLASSKRIKRIPNNNISRFLIRKFGGQKAVSLYT